MNFEPGSIADVPEGDACDPELIVSTHVLLDVPDAIPNLLAYSFPVRVHRARGVEDEAYVCSFASLKEPGIAFSVLGVSELDTVYEDGSIVAESRYES